jgi:hypothetical protein
VENAGRFSETLLVTLIQNRLDHQRWLNVSFGHWNPFYIAVDRGLEKSAILNFDFKFAENGRSKLFKIDNYIKCTKTYICTKTLVTLQQGDQTGQIFACRLIVYFGQFFKSHKKPKIWRSFFSALKAGWLDWANFRLLRNCFLWVVSLKKDWSSLNFFGYFLFTVKKYIFTLRKMGCASLWATFSKTHLVTLS